MQKPLPTAVVSQDRWRCVVVSERTQPGLHYHLPDALDPAAFHAALRLPPAGLQRSPLHLRRRACCRHVQGKICNKSATLKTFAVRAQFVNPFTPVCFVFFCSQFDLSCRNTKQNLGAMFTRTNYVTLKYVTDNWGTDSNGFKLVITAVKDPSKYIIPSCEVRKSGDLGAISLSFSMQRYNKRES